MRHYPRRMRRIFRPASLGFLLAASAFVSAQGAGRDLWQEWYHGLSQRCPSHHVEWISDDGQDKLLDQFTKTLPRSVNRKAMSLADYPQRCAKATMGFYCEMDAYLDAFIKTGLTQKFVDFACRHVRCTEAALCSTKY
jgi:hypothetical protein